MSSNNPVDAISYFVWHTWWCPAYTGFEVAKTDGLCTSATQRRRFLQALTLTGGTTPSVLRLSCARRPDPRDGAFFSLGLCPFSSLTRLRRIFPGGFRLRVMRRHAAACLFPTHPTGGFIDAYARLSRNTSARPSYRKQGGCRIGGAGVSWTPGPCPYGIPPNRGLEKTL